MSLLEDIQEAAIDSEVDLSTLLRKCKLLAARLGSEPLAEWVTWESNGYPSDVAVPDYRIWSLVVKGNFAGPLGSSATNMQIPDLLIPESFREAYERWECRQSVAAIEETVRQAKGAVRLSTGDLVVALGDNVMENMNCVQAWAEFSVLNLVEVLNTVRNRVLDLALAIWKKAPAAGDPAPTPLLSTEVVAQIINTTVYGGSANVITSGSGTIVLGIETGDFAALKQVLAEHGLVEGDLDALEAVLVEEPEAPESGGFGPKVSAWMARMMEKAASGAWKVGLGAAGSLLARAIGKYYGL